MRTPSGRLPDWLPAPRATEEGRREREGREPPPRPIEGLATSDEGTAPPSRSVGRIGWSHATALAVRAVCERRPAKGVVLACRDQRVTLSERSRSPLTAYTGSLSPHGCFRLFLAARPVALDRRRFIALQWRLGFLLPVPTMPPPVRWGRHCSARVSTFGTVLGPCLRPCLFVGASQPPHPRRAVTTRTGTPSLRGHRSRGSLTSSA